MPVCVYMVRALLHATYETRRDETRPDETRQGKTRRDKKGRERILVSREANSESTWWPAVYPYWTGFFLSLVTEWELEAGGGNGQGRDGRRGLPRPTLDTTPRRLKAQGGEVSG